MFKQQGGFGASAIPLPPELPVSQLQPLYRSGPKPFTLKNGKYSFP